MKKLLLACLILLPLALVAQNSKRLKDANNNIVAEKVARSWCDFGKQVAIEGAVTFGALSMYDALKHYYFSPHSPLLPFTGLVLFIGSVRLSRDLKLITEVLPYNYSMWASLWGIVLGAMARNV